MLGHELVDDAGGRVLGDPDILQGNHGLVRGLAGDTLQGTVGASCGARELSRGQKENPAGASGDALQETEKEPREDGFTLHVQHRVGSPVPCLLGLGLDTLSSHPGRKIASKA